MKKKPEEKTQPPIIDIPDKKGMSLPEHYSAQRTSPIMTPFNLEVERHRRRRIKFIYCFILALAMAAVLAWALTR